MARRPYPRTLDPSEVGRIARALRDELGLSLRDVRDLLGIDDSNLSKAERGVPAFEATARKAVEGLALERARRQADDPDEVREDDFRVYVEIRLPSEIHDVFDRVREAERQRRFDRFHEVFAARGVSVVRSEDDPAEAIIGDAGRLNLDSLIVNPRRYPNRSRPLAWLGSRGGDSEPDPARIERGVDRVVTFLNNQTDSPMT